VLFYLYRECLCFVSLVLLTQVKQSKDILYKDKTTQVKQSKDILYIDKTTQVKQSKAISIKIINTSETNQRHSLCFTCFTCVALSL
jgi:hypothetical protein